MEYEVNSYLLNEGCNEIVIFLQVNKGDIYFARHYRKFELNKIIKLKSKFMVTHCKLTRLTKTDLVLTYGS